MESDDNDDDVVMMTMALLILDVGDDDGLCAVSGEPMSIAHVACAFGDNGHRQTDLKLRRKKISPNVKRKEGIGERELVRENRGEREEKRIK